MVQVVGICTQNFAQMHTHTCVTQWSFKRMMLKSIMCTYTHIHKTLQPPLERLATQQILSTRFTNTISEKSVYHVPATLSSVIFCTQSLFPHACLCKSGDSQQNTHGRLLCRPIFIQFLLVLVPRLVQKQAKKISLWQSLSVILSACSHMCHPHLTQEGRKTQAWHHKCMMTRTCLSVIYMYMET